MNPRMRATVRTFGIIVLLWGGLLAAAPLVFGPAAPPERTLERVSGRVETVAPVRPARPGEDDVDVGLVTTEGRVVVRGGFCREALAGLVRGQAVTMWLGPYAGVGEVAHRAWQVESGSETLCAYADAVAAARRSDWSTRAMGLAMMALGIAALVLLRMDPTRRRRA